MGRKPTGAMSCNVNAEGMLTVWENIKNNYEKLYAAEAKVADFIMNNPAPGSGCQRVGNGGAERGIGRDSSKIL